MGCVVLLLLSSCVSVSYSHQRLKSRRFLSSPSGMDATRPEEYSGYGDRFKNVQSLYGNGSGERLRLSHVCIIGLGGVGSWAAEALARSGVSNFTIIDVDDVCVSNINRQIYTSNHIGQLKAEVLKDKILEINPRSNVNLRLDFVRKENVDKHVDLLHNFDVVLECADGVSDKAAIIDACVRKEIPVITTGGVGGLTDPTLLRISDLTKAEGDNLLKRVRTMLRQNYGYPKVPEGKKGIKPPKKKPWNILSVHTLPTGITRGLPICSSATDASSSSSERTSRSEGGFRVCDTKLGNACFTTGTAGFIMASEATKMIATGQYSYPSVHIVENEKSRSYKQKMQRSESGSEREAEGTIDSNRNLDDIGILMDF